MPGDEEVETAEWLALRVEGVIPGVEVLRLGRLAGGNSSLTYVADVRRGTVSATVVVKTIPKGLTAVRNRDIVRQGTLMAALHAHGLEVPEVIAIDPGDPPESPPVMVTSFVEGDSFDPTSPNAAQESAPSAAETAERALAAMGLLARIQHVTATELGIDAGAERSLSSELAHWSRAFETTSYAEDPIVTRTRGLLESTIPAEGRRVLVHGDYRLGNMLCTGASIRAVIDWEIWSLGDPRLDLGWFVARSCATHPSHPEDHALPAPDALLAAYAQQGGHGAEELAWFMSLSAFKHAAASALIDKRRSSDREPRASRVPDLLRWSLEQAEEARAQTR
jgi:aminoglycoside phosphotransferase (APT) family kinase protein